MANHKSAIKRHKQSLKKRTRNRIIKSSLRTLMKSIRATATATTPLTEEERKKLAVEAESTIAKAAAKGIMHKKNASRNISRMAQILRGKDLTETV